MMKMIASKSLEALLVICTMVGTASAQKDHFYPPLEEDVFSPLDEEDPLVPGDDRGIGTQDSNTVLIVAASVGAVFVLSVFVFYSRRTSKSENAEEATELGNSVP